LGSTTSDYAQFLIAIKNAMIGFSSQPWVIIASSNAIVANNNDNWNIIGDIVWANPPNPHSWIQLRQVGIETNFEIVIETQSGTQDLTLVMSPKIGFTGGGITSRPTSSDEIILLNDDRWLSSVTTFDARFHAMQSREGDCTRIIGFVSTLSGPRMLWIFDKIRNPVDGWTTPAIGSADNSSISGRYALLHDSNDYTHGYQNGPFNIYMTCESYGSAVGTLGTLLTGPNNIDCTYPMMPIGIHSETSGNRGRHGDMYDLWWGLQNVADLETYGASRLFVQFSDLIFPWDGSVPIGYERCHPQLSIKLGNLV
jgi:hypothetical protein